MVQTPWIGIGFGKPDDVTGSSGQTSVKVDVVEVCPPAVMSDWDRVFRPLLSAGRRILLTLPVVERADDEAFGIVETFCERYGADGNLEGVVLDFAEPDEDLVGPYLDVLDDRDFPTKAYVRIDTGLPMDRYPDLIRMLRVACDRGAIPYIVRPSDTAYADSFLHTRYFTAAARLRRSPFVLAATSEPASPASAVSAIFETVASGAAGLVLSDEYFNDAETVRALTTAATHLQANEPTPNTAMLWPSTADLADKATAELFRKLAVSLRDITDYDILDERRVCEGCLANYQVVILAAGCCYERDALETVCEWVKGGGMLLANCVGTVRCPDGETTFNRDLLDRELAAPNPAACCTMRRICDGASFHYSHDVARSQHKGISTEDGFICMVARVLRRNVLLGADKIEPDALLDGVHAARLRDRILLLNVTDETVTQEILLPSTLGTRKVDLPPLEITALPLEDLLADQV